MATKRNNEVIVYFTDEGDNWENNHYFATWTSKNGIPVGGHEIGHKNDDPLLLLCRLAEIMELP